MKSPCHDCDYYNADKNNSICMECDKRVKYAQGLNACLDPSIKIERRAEGMSYKKGTCNNCERPDMYLPSLGRCCMCYSVVRKAQQNGESVEAALAVTKERVKSGVNLKSKYRAKKSGAGDQGPGVGDQPKPVTYKIDKGRLIQGVNVLCLEFFPSNERDMRMFEWIKQIAAEHRRNPEQEIMWILQHYISADEELDACEKLTPEP